MWAVERNILGRRESKVANFSYFSQGQVAVVISSNILQFLKIERDDFVVQSRQLLLLDIIVWLVWNDGDFWRKTLCQEDLNKIFETLHTQAEIVHCIGNCVDLQVLPVIFTGKVERSC